MSLQLEQVTGPFFRPALCLAILEDYERNVAGPQVSNDSRSKYQQRKEQRLIRTVVENGLEKGRVTVRIIQSAFIVHKQLTFLSTEGEIVWGQEKLIDSVQGTSRHSHIWEMEEKNWAIQRTAMGYRRVFTEPRTGQKLPPATIRTMHSHLLKSHPNCDDIRKIKKLFKVPQELYNHCEKKQCYTNHSSIRHALLCQDNRQFIGVPFLGTNERIIEVWDMVKAFISQKCYDNSLEIGVPLRYRLEKNFSKRRNAHRYIARNRLLDWRCSSFTNCLELEAREWLYRIHRGALEASNQSHGKDEWKAAVSAYLENSDFNQIL